MTHQNPWDLLRSGNAKQGLDLVREGYVRDPSPSRIMQLGVAHLWVQDYQAACTHFHNAIEKYPNSMSGFYGMAGVAKWCMGDPDTAVEYWRSGLDAKYGDGAGGVHLPLLLYVASILRPMTFSRTEAAQLLTKKVRDARVKNWPGPIAKFVLSLLDVESLKDMSIEGSSHEAPPYRKWLIRFYKGVLEFGRGNLKSGDFKELMGAIADIVEPEWLEEKNFLRLLWSEEFFLARHEASQD